MYVRRCACEYMYERTYEYQQTAPPYIISKKRGIDKHCNKVKNNEDCNIKFETMVREHSRLGVKDLLALMQQRD